MIDNFISEYPQGFHSDIDGRNFLPFRREQREQAYLRCRAHVAAILRAQDGDEPQERTLSERRNLFVAGVR